MRLFLLRKEEEKDRLLSKQRVLLFFFFSLHLKIVKIEMRSNRKSSFVETNSFDNHLTDDLPIERRSRRSSLIVNPLVRFHPNSPFFLLLSLEISLEFRF